MIKVYWWIREKGKRLEWVIGCSNYSQETWKQNRKQKTKKKQWHV